MTKNTHTEILSTMAQTALAKIKEAKDMGRKTAEERTAADVAKAHALGKFQACEEMARAAKLTLSLGDALIGLI